MVISIANIVKSRALARFFTQPGIVGSGDGGGDEDSNGGDGSIAGGDSVVKALTALQAL